MKITQNKTPKRTQKMIKGKLLNNNNKEPNHESDYNGRCHLVKVRQLTWISTGSCLRTACRAPIHVSTLSFLREAVWVPWLPGVWWGFLALEGSSQRQIPKPRYPSPAERAGQEERFTALHLQEHLRIRSRGPFCCVPFGTFVIGVPATLPHARDVS